MAKRQIKAEKIAKHLLRLCLVLTVLGLGVLAYWFYFSTREIRVAVSNPSGEDATVLSAVNTWMASDKRRFRLKIIPTGSPKNSLEKLRSGEVDVASLRADRVEGQHLSSIMVLFNEVAGIVMHANADGDAEWSDLLRAKIAVPRGTAPDDPLLRTLLRLNGIHRPDIISDDVDKVRQDFMRKRIQAIGFVAPIPGYASKNFHYIFDSKTNALAMPGVDDPDMLANKDQRYNSATIDAGSLRSNPPVPSVATGTLSVGRNLIMLSSANRFLVGNFVRTMLDARRALFVDQPLLRQAVAPDTDADAFLKVHPAAQQIYDGDEPSWSDVAIEWVYLIPMVVGALGTMIFWGMRHFVYPDFSDPETLVVELLDVRLDASSAMSETALLALKTRVDEVAQELVDGAGRYAGLDGTSAVLTSMLIAENGIYERREQLRNPQHALCSDDRGEITSMAVEKLIEAGYEGDTPENV